MEEPDWRAQLAKSVAEEVRRLRLERGLSVQRVADLFEQEYGLPMKRSVLANFEGGRRPALSVAELVVLARILEVPPVQLLFPVGRQAETPVFPEAVDTWEALKWFTGEQSWVPQPAGSNLTQLQTVKDVELFRQHDAAELAVQDARRMILAFVPTVPLVGDPGVQPPPASPALLSELTTVLGRAEEDLLALRRQIRSRDLTPPRLSSDVAYLSEREEPE